MEPLQYEPITTLGKLAHYQGFHFWDPLGGLFKASQTVSPGP